jgi:four helix bundle protein
MAQNALRSFRDLIVWQRGMDLVEAVYRLVAHFPGYEVYGLRKQMQRSAVSIPSNITEGYGRKHRKEYLHHLSIAQGSLQELDTHIEIAFRIGLVTRQGSEDCLVLIDEVGRMLCGLLRSLGESLTPRP